MSTSSNAPVFDLYSLQADHAIRWDNAARAWHRLGALLQWWLGPATELMLDLAGVKAGVSAGKVITAIVRQSASSPPEVWVGAIGDYLNQGVKPAWGEMHTMHGMSGTVRIPDG